MTLSRTAEDQQFIDGVKRIEEFACRVESVAVKLQRLAILIRDPEIRVAVSWLLDHGIEQTADAFASADEEAKS
jgi:hypothetical protein